MIKMRKYNDISGLVLLLEIQKNMAQLNLQLLTA